MTKKGNRVEVNFNDRTVRVVDGDGKVVRNATPPGHVVMVAVDPNDENFGVSLEGKLAPEDRDKQDLGRLAVQAALPSAGSVARILGDEDPAVGATSVARDNAKRDNADKVHAAIEEKKAATEKANQKAEAKASGKDS